MTDHCRSFRERLINGLADWQDYNHVEICSACELWLQEHVNFRNMQLSPSEHSSKSLKNPPCEAFLSSFAESEFNPDETSEAPCPCCEESRTALYTLHRVLHTSLPVSRSLNKRLVGIGRTRTSLLVQVLQIAAALLIAAMLTYFSTPFGKTEITQRKGLFSKKMNIELSLARAYLYKLYGEARGRLAYTMAQNNTETKEEKNEVSVPSGE